MTYLLKLVIYYLLNYIAYTSTEKLRNGISYKMNTHVYGCARIYYVNEIDIYSNLFHVIRSNFIKNSYSH